MPEQSLTDKIKDALRAQGGDMRDDARQLLNTLGYHSTRTLPQTWAPREMLQFFGSRRDGVNEREFRESARKIAIVFQTGDEEIQRGAGNDLLIAEQFQKGDARSFFFVVADLKPGDEYSRGRLARMTRAINSCFNAPAVVVFRHNHPNGARLVSLAFVHRRKGRDNRTRHVLGRVSILRGIRRETPHRGHLDILADLAISERMKWMRAENKPQNFDGLLAAWLNALDTEELNKRFYKKLLAWFERAVHDCKFPDGKIAGKSEEQVMRMITRLLFIWFVKEKGLAPEDLFTEKFAAETLKNHKAENSDYYRAILQNLFFGTLNTPQQKRAFRKRDDKGKGDPKQYRDFNLYRYEDLLKNSRQFIQAAHSVPFVNGGLFDCLDGFETGGDREDRLRVDCFTDNPVHRKLLTVPSRLFFAKDDGLFTLFNQFKFTVDENTPLDQEVALDPELLGLVFENLLAAITPESRENARKQTGSFYTPRPIVEYMVDEALTAHLAGILGKKSEPKLRKLLEWGDIADDLFSAKEEKTITDAIDKLRILDPAVGSGAFPMGMLHKLVHILSRVDDKNKKWKEKQLEKAAEISDPSVRGRTMDDIERVFSAENNYDDYGRKLFLIQNAIHGADLQPVAAQIARLRFFISLIIDQKPNENEDNRGIEPLPNLETKFVAADSLIGLARKGQADLSETEEVRELKADIDRVRADHFGAKRRADKHRLRAKDKELRGKLAKALAKLGFAQSDANRFAAWDLYDQTAGADWFDAELMMGVRDGFDIVIGNPPYVRHELFAAKKPALKVHFKEFFASTADLYTYFYRKGLSELRKGGHLSFITSNKFMRVRYGKNTRELLAKNSTIRTLVDFGELPVFKASTDPVIVIAQNAPPQDDARLITAVVKNAEDIPRVGEFIREQGVQFPISEMPSGAWSMESGEHSRRLLEKMRRVGTPLGKIVGGAIHYGVKTGCNSAFLIDDATRHWLITEDPKSAEIIKPWLRGREIKKWCPVHPAKHGLFIPRGTDIARYPAARRHLAQFKSQLLRRAAPEPDQWFALQAEIPYHQAFAEPKIVYPDIALAMRASYDESGVFSGNTTFIIPTKDLSILGFMHSKAFDWFARHTFQTLGDPWHGGRLRFFTQNMEQVPFPPMGKKDKAEISRRVKAILRSPSGPDVAGLESEIDEIVHRLYGLTAAEIRLVESGGG